MVCFHILEKKLQLEVCYVIDNLSLFSIFLTANGKVKMLPNKLNICNFNSKMSFCCSSRRVKLTLKVKSLENLKI